MSFIASRLGADTVVRDMSTEAIEAAAARMAELDRTQEPGIGHSLPVTEGVVWQAMQREALAQRLYEDHQARWVRALQQAPDEPRFLRGLGFTGMGTGAESHPIGMSVGGMGDGITYIDGIPLVDPAWLDAQLGGPFQPGRLDGLDIDIPRGMPEGGIPWGGPGDGPHGPLDPGELDRFDFTPKRCGGEGSGWGTASTCPEPPVGSTALGEPPSKGVFDPVLEPLEWQGYTFLPTTPSHPCRVVLLLHGKGDSAAAVEMVGRSYAAAGFRTLAIDWPTEDCTVRGLCAADGANVDDATWDGCLVQKRFQRMLIIMLRTQQALIHLKDNRLPEEGWGDFLETNNAGVLSVDWAKVILAGFSEGANQQAFNLRWLPAPGAIFLSGGGDASRPSDATIAASGPMTPGDCANLTEDITDLSAAGWMTQLPMSEHRLGYVHAAEAFDPHEGWSANGVADTRLLFTDALVSSSAGVPVSSLASFGGAARLEGDVSPGPTYGAHTSPLEATATMHLMHHYMVCRAGGIYES